MEIKVARLHKLTNPLIIEKSELNSPLTNNVTIKIHFAGINYYEKMLIEGKYPTKSNLPFTIGGELSGTVVAIGEGVKEFQIGDHVFSFAQTGVGTTGSYATYANIETKYLYKLPNFLSFDNGAAFPMVFFTAFAILTQKVHLNESQIVLVHSAAGGVGSTLVRLIRILYPKTIIIGTYSLSQKEKIIKDYGVDITLNTYSQNLLSEIKDKFPSGIDIIFDPVGQLYMDTHLKLMKPLTGTICSYGTYSGPIEDKNFVRKLRSINGTLAGFLMWPLIEDKKWCQKQFNTIFGIMKKYKILPEIDKIYPLEEVNKAITRLKQRKNIGKILLSCNV